jgi:hypothetical protein
MATTAPVVTSAVDSQSTSINTQTGRGHRCPRPRFERRLGLLQRRDGGSISATSRTSW